MTLYVQLDSNGDGGAHSQCRRLGTMSCAVLSVASAVLLCMLPSALSRLCLSHDPSTGSGWARLSFRDESGVSSLATIAQGLGSAPQAIEQRSFHSRFHPQFRQAPPHSKYKDRGGSSTMGNAFTEAIAFEALGSMPRMPGTERKPEGNVEMVHSEQEFEQRLRESNLIMLAVSSQFCGPCKIFAPIYERLAADYMGKARFLKVEPFESDSTQGLADRFHVKSLPSFFLIRDGEVVAQHMGATAEFDLRSDLLEYMR